MDWPYHFFSLTPDQAAERRRLLDLYGWYAWLSSCTAVGTIYLARMLFAKLYYKKSSWKLLSHFRRISWAFDTPLPTDFGSVKVHPFGLAYLAWLSFLCVHKTGADYMHLTKRLGHVAVSQLLFQYLLPIKATWSPIQLATGLSHETLNPYHRLCGRIIHIFLTAHMLLYLNFFFVISVLSTRLYDRDAQFGLLSFFFCLACFPIWPSLISDVKFLTISSISHTSFGHFFSFQPSTFMFPTRANTFIKVCYYISLMGFHASLELLPLRLLLSLPSCQDPQGDSAYRYPWLSHRLAPRLRRGFPANTYI